jgi:hypothetical protein
MKKSFEEWMREVDAEMDRLSHMVSADIGDYLYYDAYEAGRRAKSVARAALKAYGMLVE